MSLSDMLVMITVLAIWDNMIKPLTELAQIKIMTWVKAQERSDES